MENSELYDDISDAVYDQDIDAISALLKKGGDLNEAYADEDEPYTFLSMAEDHTDLSFADELVKAGADPDKTADFRITMSGDDALCESLHMGSMLSAVALLERNLNVNHEYRSASALHYACTQFKNHGKRVVPIVEKLLSAGADPTRKDEEGRTAISITEGAIVLYDSNEAKVVLDLLKKAQGQLHSAQLGL